MTKKDLLAPGPKSLPATPEILARAETFVLERWRERAAEKGLEPPDDLAYACKFSSLFTKTVFGGELRGNEQHQFNLVDGQIVDLNRNAQDVRTMSNPYRHDPKFFGNRDHLASLNSCLPRITQWAETFIATA